jgi:lipoprotein-releasing system permease protein
LNFLFAWRYFNAKKTTNAINIIAWISVVAIAVGSAALIVLLSVFNGFEDLVKSLYANFYTDLRIVPSNGKTFLLTDAQQKKIAGWPGIKKMAFTIEERALLQNGEYQQLVLIKGVDSNYRQVNGVAGSMAYGSYNIGSADKPAAVLGVGVENSLGIQSDRAILPMTVYLPKKGIHASVTDPLQSLSADNIFASGSFAIQQDFDNNYAITHIDFVKRMMGLPPNEYGAVEIALSNIKEEANVQQSLQDWLGNGYRVETRYQQNKSLYSTMRGEKWFIFILLSFILVVAAFTMIGALTMLVLEKQKDIQILKAMGGYQLLIQKIFLSEGLLLATIGGALGILLSFFIGFLQIKFGIIKLPGSTFIIDRYPIKFVWTDILLVLTTVFTIALLASWFPSRKASLEPIELRS